MRTLQGIVEAAMNWEPHALGNDFSIFVELEGESDKDREVREMAKLLALRVDRHAPDWMVDSQAQLLARLINPQVPVEDPAQQPGLTLGQQVALGVAIGVAGSALVRGKVGRQVLRAAVNAAVYPVVRHGVGSLLATR
jgi:hypothetical protein